MLAVWAIADTACYRGLDDGVRADGGEAPSTSADGTVSVGSDSSGGTDGDVPPADLEPAPPTIHRLTQAQVHNTWLAVLGEPLVLPTDLPADDLLYGFTSIAAA